MKIFDRRGLILKFDTMRNQSVPILVSNLSNKPITNLQIANPFSQTRVSRYKVLALQKDRACRTFPLWFFFLCEPITGDAGQPSVSQRGTFSINQCYTGEQACYGFRCEMWRTMRSRVSLYPDWEHWIWLNVGTYEQNIRHNIQTAGCVPSWMDRIGNYEARNWKKKCRLHDCKTMVFSPIV
jgi:hypothetical protein